MTNCIKAINVPVHLLPNLVRPINLFHDYHGIKECISLIRTIKPDIIHAHSSKAGLIARIAGGICRVPVVFTAHGWGFSPGNRLKMKLYLELPKIVLKLDKIPEKNHYQ